MIAEFSGVVVGGKRIGHKMGFPTANIAPDAPVALPRNGVYAADIWLNGEKDPRRCVLNQGKHPTFPEGSPTIEAHIICFNSDIYGEKVDVKYIKFLRPEQKFDDIDALKAQISRDIEAALRA